MNYDATTAHSRQFERHAARYEVRLAPLLDHADQFRLAVPEAQAGLAVSDVSSGGLGLRSEFFLPKNLRVGLHVKGLDGNPIGARSELSIRAIVRSCTMVDYRPTYQVGLQFIDPAGRDEQTLVKQAMQPVFSAQPAVGG